MTVTISISWSAIAGIASAGAACSGGQDAARMADAMMISGRRQIPMTRRIRTNHRGICGLPGISRGNRRTGAGAGYFTRHITARIFRNTRDSRLRIVWRPLCQYSRMGIYRAAWWILWGVRSVTDDLKNGWIDYDTRKNIPPSSSPRPDHSLHHVPGITPDRGWLAGGLRERAEGRDIGGGS